MRSRKLLVGLVAGASALVAPSAAGAAAKDVTIGVPNRAEGAQIRSDGGDVNDFFPRFIAINVDDSIRFRPLGSSPHTVDIPGRGQRPRRWFMAVDPKVAGVEDAENKRFWFNGQNNLFFTPALQTRRFGETLTYNGSTRVESGRSEGAPNKDAMTVTFTRTGTYDYFCDLHPGMRGTVAVRASNRRVASKATDDRRVEAQMKAALETLRRLKNTRVPPNTVNVGAAGANGVEYYGFLPSPRPVAAGATVTFRISRASRESHTATTGPPDYLTPLTASFDDDTAPFDPIGFYPSERGRTVAALAPPQPHGNAFWNSGLLDNAANTSRPTSGKLRFAAPGSYDFMCLIHPDMKLKVNVVQNPRDRGTGGIKPPPPPG